MGLADNDENSAALSLGAVIWMMLVAGLYILVMVVKELVHMVI